MSASLSKITVHVPTGQQRDFQTDGHYLLAETANVEFILEGEGLRIPMREGRAVQHNRSLGKCLVINETATDLEAVIVHGSSIVTDHLITGEVRLDDTASVNLDDDAAVAIKGGAALASPADVPLAAGVATQIAAQNLTRRYIEISNLSGNGYPIRIGTNNSGGRELVPGETVRLETSAIIYGYCSGGQSVGVMEVSA